MKVKNLIFFSLILAGLVIESPVWPQVVVERSKDKVIISGKPYYIHIVKKGETSYSISKAYGISVDELVKENPQAAKGIRDGQSLRLPVVENIQSEKVPAVKTTDASRDEAKFIYHKLSKGDTVYSLAKKYGVSEEDILKSNPGAEINRLPVGSEIAIPRREFSVTSKELEPEKDPDFINYKVSKGESITSIAEKYGLSVRELRRFNKGVVFPKVDDYIRIPVQRIAVVEGKPDVPADTVKVDEKEEKPEEEKATEITLVGDLRGKYNVAVMLPLYYPENAIRSEIDSSQTIKGKKIRKLLRRSDSWIYEGTTPFLEMLQGILIAADTLRSKGLDISLSIYDVKEDTTVSQRIIESGDLDKTDLIIGPVYSNNLKIVADFARDKEIPVVSPVPLWNNSAVTDRPYLFMAVPSLEVSQEAIAKRILNFPSGNFVFIHSDTLRNDPNVRSFKDMIFRELSSKIPYEEIRFKEFLFKSRSSLPNDSINRLEHAMSDKMENIVLIASEDPSVLSETIMDLHTLSRKYNIRFIGYPRVRELINLDPKFFFELGIELYSPEWLDYGEDDVRAFNTIFRKKFLTEPSEESYAWEGYDITYYFLSGLAMHGKRFLRNPGIHNPDLLEMQFDFLRLGDDNGFENHKLYLIKYTGDMEVKVLEENF